MASSYELSATARRVVAVALLGTTVMVGCRSSQQTASISNPFLSADRVPAPASRIPAAGTAQPYYPGQVAPSMPMAPQATQPMQPLGALPPSDDITPLPADGSLVEASQPSPAALASNDSAVRIPGDESTMRFAAPTTLPETVTQPLTAPGSTPQPVALAANPTPVATTPTVFRDNQPPPTAPVINNWPPQTDPAPQVTLTPVYNHGAASGLFRDPAVPAQTPLENGATTQPGMAQPATTQPITSPRTRIPGAAEMIREEVVPGTVNTTSYQVGMAGGVEGAPLVIPPPGYVPSSFEPASPTTPVADGFVPRGSSRERSDSGFANPGIPTIHVTPG